MNVYLGELYKEVQYIQSDGNQIIDTGVYGTGSTSIVTKMIVTGRKRNYDMYYGAYMDNGVGAFFIQSNYPNNNKLRVVNYSNDASTRKYVDSINNLQFNTEYIIEHTNTEFKINGTLQGTMTSSSFTTSHTLCMFGVHLKAGTLDPCLIGKVYYFKIYESGTLIRDFVPCYRVSDNVIGLFDKVENKFYTNAGTGTFTKGADVKTFQAELKNAYIGEVWTPGANTLLYLPLKSDLNDYSGNNKNFSVYTGSVSYADNMMKLNNATIRCSSMALTGTGDFTILCYNKNGGAISLWNDTDRYPKLWLRSLGLEIYNYGWYKASDSGYDGICFLVGVRKNNSLYFYRNGALIASNTNVPSINISGGPGMYIGGYANTSDNGYYGSVIVENRAWTADEILKFYNDTKSTYGL